MTTWISRSHTKGDVGKRHRQGDRIRRIRALLPAWVPGRADRLLGGVGDVPWVRGAWSRLHQVLGS